MYRPCGVRPTLAGLLVASLCLTGCPAPKGESGKAGPTSPSATGGSRETNSQPQGRGPAAKKVPAAPAAPAATAKADEVQAAMTVLDGLGRNAKYTLSPEGVLTEVIVQDGSASPPIT